MKETLNQCLTLVTEYLEDRDIVLARGVDDWEHINYESQDERHYEIVSIKGKATKQYLHVYIYRHETGRYELNLYTL
jgi:hypothetical protein